MRTLRGRLTVALVLVSALAVVASPAFATPNLTASSGTDTAVPHLRAVAPFITPSGSTRSSYTGQSSDTAVSLPLLGATVSCTTANLSGYVSSTHTQMRITSLSFGDGGSCTMRPVGTVDSVPITCTASSGRPWHFHVRSVNGASRSASGTINTTSSCVISLTVSGRAITTTVDSNQSCRPAGTGLANHYTWTGATGSLVVNCRVTVTVTGALRASTTATLTGTFTFRNDLRLDPILTVTSSS
jgi:hypothetical protein